MSAEGLVFRSMINPKNLSYFDLIRSWEGIRVHDRKENIKNPPGDFSDESLMRALIGRWDKESKLVTHIERNVDIHNEWIDRTWWNIDEEKLGKGKYITCNMLRPMDENLEYIEPLIEYVYGSETPEVMDFINKVKELL